MTDHKSLHQIAYDQLVQPVKPSLTTAELKYLFDYLNLAQFWKEKFNEKNPNNISYANFRLLGRNLRQGLLLSSSLSSMLSHFFL